jgi:hypothetical protein
LNRLRKTLNRATATLDVFDEKQNEHEQEKEAAAATVAENDHDDNLSIASHGAMTGSSSSVVAACVPRREFAM